MLAKSMEKAGETRNQHFLFCARLSSNKTAGAGIYTGSMWSFLHRTERPTKSDMILKSCKYREVQDACSRIYLRNTCVKSCPRNLYCNGTDSGTEGRSLPTDLLHIWMEAHLPERQCSSIQSRLLLREGTTEVKSHWCE